MLTDLRHAVRLFARRPGLTCADRPHAGLGIGANAAIFSLVRAVLLRPCPTTSPIWSCSRGRTAPTSADARAARDLTGHDVIEWHRRGSPSNPSPSSVRGTTTSNR
jgi:hypothetical protein